MHFSLAGGSVRMTAHRNFGMTRPAATTGACPLPASRGVTQYYADNSISFAPAERLSGRALLERGYVAQALIDSTAVLFGFLFFVSLALSVPLALFLLIFARF
jgi:hypothetical protein